LVVRGKALSCSRPNGLKLSITRATLDHGRPYLFLVLASSALTLYINTADEPTEELVALRFALACEQSKTVLNFGTIDGALYDHFDDRRLCEAMRATLQNFNLNRADAQRLVFEHTRRSQAPAEIVSAQREEYLR